MGLQVNQGRHRRLRKPRSARGSGSIASESQPPNNNSNNSVQTVKERAKDRQLTVMIRISHVLWRQKTARNHDWPTEKGRQEQQCTSNCASTFTFTCFLYLYMYFLTLPPRLPLPVPQSLRLPLPSTFYLLPFYPFPFTLLSFYPILFSFLTFLTFSPF